MRIAALLVLVVCGARPRLHHLRGHGPSVVHGFGQNRRRVVLSVLMVKGEEEQPESRRNRRSASGQCRQVVFVAYMTIGTQKRGCPCLCISVNAGYATVHLIIASYFLSRFLIPID